MQQSWFEMPEVRGRKFADAVWVPLRVIHRIEETGRNGYPGYRSEFFGGGSVAIPTAQKAEVEKKLGWMDVGISHSHGGLVHDGRYIPADVFEDRGITGVHLVLEQRGNTAEHSEWHLHQDLVVTLRLRREGDTWLSLDEGYVEVARIGRNADGGPRTLEIRSSHLRDYLAARDMSLYITSYRDRSAISMDRPAFTWPENPYQVLDAMDRWEGRIVEIAPGGMPFGSGTAVFHVSRTDVDAEVDVPTFDFPNDEKTASKSWTVEHKSAKCYRVAGELWRNEWVDPAASSPRVRGDKTESNVSFIIDAEGKQAKSQTLTDGIRWLWFRPDVIPALAHRRGGGLKWYTKDTGGVECSPGHSVHFGVNSIGLVTVLAKDVSLLPEWQQKIWAGYNVAPDGKVSDELLASQMRAAPAATKAPEAFLERVLTQLAQVSANKLGVSILRPHEDVPELLRRVHRFRATDKAGLYALAKDLARLTADSLDATAMQKLAPPPAGNKLRSLKSLENLLAARIGPEKAARLLGPLHGVYELRLADAHLPSKEKDEALKLLKVDPSAPFVVQGYQILHVCVGTLYAVIDILSK